VCFVWFVWFVVKKIAPGGEAGGGSVEYDSEHDSDHEHDCENDYDLRLRSVTGHPSSVNPQSAIRNGSQCSKTGRYFTAKRYATTPRVTTNRVMQISIQDGK